LQKLGRKARKRIERRTDPIHEEYRVARNKFSESIKRTKEEHWKEWLEDLTITGTWNFHKYASSDPGDQVHTRIKTLQDPTANGENGTTQDNNRKSELLYNVFFRPSPENDYVDPEHAYPPPVCEFNPITDKQIHRAITKLSPYKAPGLNGISNIVFIKCADILVPYMGPIFRATFSLRVYPDEWKRLSTIVLRKPGRPDYSIPKAYRPITLLDTMAKILSSCVADDLTYIAEEHNLLPQTHFGGRPGRSTIDSLHLLTKFITNSWASKHDHVSLLFLNVKAAFPSVVAKRLLHNLRNAGIPEEYVSWYGRRLENHTTHLFFDDHKSSLFNIQDGLDQGCPLSPFGFIVYNSGVLNVADPNPRRGELSLGFIDDVALVARGESYEESNAKLKNMMEKSGGALEWSEEQNAEFELEKTALICLSRKRIPNPESPRKTIPSLRKPITIRNHTIQPSKSHKFLGIIIDKNLNFKEQAARALAKGTKYAMACTRMIRPTKGIHGKLMKRLYEGVIVPKMLYAADVWCAGLISKGRGKKGRRKRRQGIRIATG